MTGQRAGVRGQAGRAGAQRWIAVKLPCLLEHGPPLVAGPHCHITSVSVIPVYAVNTSLWGVEVQGALALMLIPANSAPLLYRLPNKCFNQGHI